MEKKTKADQETKSDHFGTNIQDDKPKKDGLVPMTKNGETIRVHPTCINGHELAGWKFAE